MPSGTPACVGLEKVTRYRLRIETYDRHTDVDQLDLMFHDHAFRGRPSRAAPHSPNVWNELTRSTAAEWRIGEQKICAGVGRRSGSVKRVE